MSVNEASDSTSGIVDVSINAFKQKFPEVKKGEEIFIIEDESYEHAENGNEESLQDSSIEKSSMKSDDYAVNSKVLCSSCDGLYYEAKIIGIEMSPHRGKMYTIHYQGWNSRYDEKISEEVARHRFLPLNEKNFEEAKKKMEEARQPRKSKGLSQPGKEIKMTMKKCTDLPMPLGLDNSAKRIKQRGKNATYQNNKGVQTTTSDFKFEIKLPAELRDLLTDDLEKIVHEKYLTKLPAQYTVDQILCQYVSFHDGPYDVSISSARGTVLHCVNGIKRYFNACLESRLLYSCERAQFYEIRKLHLRNRKRQAAAMHNSNRNIVHSGEMLGKQSWEPSQTYGFIHLIRLLYKISELFKVADWGERSEESITSTLDNVKALLTFLKQNCVKFFDLHKDYVPASST